MRRDPSGLYRHADGPRIGRGVHPPEDPPANATPAADPDRRDCRRHLLPGFQFGRQRPSLGRCRLARAGCLIAEPARRCTMLPARCPSAVPGDDPGRGGRRAISLPSFRHAAAEILHSRKGPVDFSPHGERILSLRGCQVHNEQGERPMSQMQAGTIALEIPVAGGPAVRGNAQCRRPAFCRGACPRVRARARGTFGPQGPTAVGIRRGTISRFSRRDGSCPPDRLVGRPYSRGLEGPPRRDHRPDGPENESSTP